MLALARRAAFLCFALSFIAVAAGADERPAVKLLRPDSLLGWEHGEKPQGWTIEHGVLTGAKNATKLVSGWTLGDFELTLEYRAAAGTAVEVLLESEAAKTRVAVQLGDDIVVDKTMAGSHSTSRMGFGTPLDYSTVTIRREGGRLEIRAKGDGSRAVSKGGVPADARFLLALDVEGGAASIKNLELKEPAGEPIFNDKDLSGWWTPGNKDAWHAENGELVKRGSGGNYLRTEKEYGNFILSFEYRINQGGNSGVGIRTHRKGWPSAEGMELQLQDRPGLDKHSTMAIYGNLPPVARADKSERWNRAVIKADGPMISAWVNGELVQQANTARHPELKHRLAKGWIGFQDHGGVDRFRDIRVLELPPGAGPSVWREERPASAADLVLNRLMNTEQLAVNDGVRTGRVKAEVQGEGEQVLAELTGPGALVGAARSNDAGRIAFYFDGEKKPRFECRAKDLAGHLPHLMQHQHPIRTYVPYEKSLKIVLADGAPGAYWFDYVTTPAGTEIHTFAGKETAVPRGWYSPIVYRHGQGDWGVLRTFDPYPQAGLQDQKIEPGSAARLVALEGSGVVHWLQLKLPKSARASDDLWLEIKVDGESEPAIFAPARYLFAPVRDDKRHHNFLFTARAGGFASRLAMPFGRGLTITAHNKGDKPIQGVGATVSYREVSAEAADELMRLRGDFQQEAGPVELRGGGRLIGLVCEYENAAQTRDAAVASLTLDGRKQAAWSGASLALLLGADGDEDFRRVTTGRVGSLAWRYFLLAPIQFDQSLVLQFSAPRPDRRFVLYYAK
jgi:hypothetical protein